MFGLDWSDPQTWWLNVTNLGLGIVTIAAFCAIGYGVVMDLLAKRKAAAASNLDRELDGLLAARSPHAFHTPELGLTMADGGEPEPPTPNSKQRKTK